MNQKVRSYLIMFSLKNKASEFYRQAVISIVILFNSPVSIACDLNNCTDIHDYRNAKNSLTDTDFTCTKKT